MTRGTATLTVALTGVLTAAIMVPASATLWVDQEWVSAPVGAADRGEAVLIDATAWGWMLAGNVGTEALDPAVAIDGRSRR